VIPRQNYRDVKKYLAYKKRVLQADPLTVAGSRVKLWVLLKWANDIRLPEAHRVYPILPEFLLTYRADGGEKPLSPIYMRKICSEARMFYGWARNNLRDYSQVSLGWVDTLRPRRSAREQTMLKQREIWTLEEVRQVARYPVKTLKQRRAQAALVFLFLSGMRVTAFSTLRIGCVDIQRRRVEQLPEKGVITKNRIAAITFLLPIDDLLEVVRDWDGLVRSQLGEEGLWFAKIKSRERVLDPDDTLGRPEYAYNARHRALKRGMRELCKLAGVEYKSPHKLRHGHGVYGVKHARTVAELKAVSQNLMHANVGITDGIYGNLPEDDVADILSGFTPNRDSESAPSANGDAKAVLEQVQRLLEGMS